MKLATGQVITAELIEELALATGCLFIKDSEQSWEIIDVVATKQEYYDSISNWDWVAIVAEAEELGRSFLGTVFALYPSGKYMHPLTSDTTTPEFYRDVLFAEVLEDIAAEYNGNSINGDDPVDLFFCLEDCDA